MAEKNKKVKKMKKEVFKPLTIFEPDFENLPKQKKQICEGLFKIIMELDNPEIAKRLDIDEITASKLRGMIMKDLEPFLKTVK